MRWGLAAACATLVGCAHPAGPVFPPLAEPKFFPPPPDEPRITFVGTLSNEADLKPAKSPLTSLGEALFGQNSTNSMLSPYSICTSGHRVFVCDSNSQLVHVFDLESRAYAQWKPSPDGKGQGFGQPVGIAADAAGRIFVSDSVAAVIFLFDATGHCLGEIGHGSLKRPCGIAYDSAHDRLLVADSGLHQVIVLSLDGTLIAAIGQRGSALGEFNYPTNVALDHTGRLFVSDTLNFRVQVFDLELKPLRQIGRLGDMPGYFSQPKGIAVDSENHVYVVDSHFEAVQLFDPDGTLLMSFGEEGTGPGQFWIPAGIFIDLNDRIWIADSYNRRVQVFDFLSQARRDSASATGTDATPEIRP